jgi:lactoylglutathione lyase
MNAPHPAPGPVDAPAVARYGQPNLYTDDVDRMSGFYRRLGFTETWRFPSVGDADPAFACLRLGTFFVTVSLYSALHRAVDLPRIGRSERSQMEIVVIVDDVDATVERLRADGVEVVLAPQDQLWGERHAYLLDPEGNYVQITTHSDVDWSESALSKGWE